MKESETEYRIYWIVNNLTFWFPVGSVEEAVSILMVLYRYDKFRDVNIKPTGGLEYKKIKENDWEVWQNEEGEDIWKYMDRRYAFYIDKPKVETSGHDFIKKVKKEEEAFKNIDFVVGPNKKVAVDVEDLIRVEGELDLLKLQKPELQFSKVSRPSGVDPVRTILGIIAKYKRVVIKESKCKCGAPGKEQFDNGLSVGIHCDKCFQEMVDKCRKRSW